MKINNNCSNFIHAKSLIEISHILGVKYKLLTYCIYGIKTPSSRYSKYHIKKRNGRIREISAPRAELKYLQRVLASFLIQVYPNNNCTHGFVSGRSIKTNAELHKHKKWVVNIDLQDFFPSIHFGRVLGLFSSRPFNFPDKLARELANLCCNEGILPQGAPTSPIISNFICWRLDNQLQKFARNNKIVYSRYADDITFSSNLKSIPETLGIVQGNTLLISDQLVQIISSNGFRINESKTRFSYRNSRQEVTGLIVNSSNVNVRRKFVMQVRAMIHAWEKYGLKLASDEHFNKFNYKNKRVIDAESQFISELQGKVGFIKYIKRVVDAERVINDSVVTVNLIRRIKRLAPDFHIHYNIKAAEDAHTPMIFCEGKTDWKLIKKALQWFRNKEAFLDLNICFREYEEDQTAGSQNLLHFCKASTVPYFKYRCICLFDRDEPNTSRQVTSIGQEYKYWGNNIVSALIPKPDFRSYNEISIEMLLTDREIQTCDKDGRRLYLSTEFDKKSGQLLLNNSISCQNKARIQSTYPKIVDKAVFDKNNKNIALSKSNFADYCYHNIHPFDTFSYEGFRPLFERIEFLLQCDFSHDKTS